MERSNPCSSVPSVVAPCRPSCHPPIVATRRKKILIALGCVVLAVLAITFLSRNTEPTYEGHPLSYWVIAYGRPFLHESDKDAIGKAISHIGTNAIPYLIKWIQYKEPREPDWKTGIRELFAVDPFGVRIFPQGPVIRADFSPQAFGAIGPVAEDTIAELTRLANQSQSDLIARRAIYALAWTRSTNALPPLIQITTNSNHQGRRYATTALGLMGQTARPALPILLADLQDPQIGVACQAAWSLGNLRMEPELVVPALIRALEDSRSDVRFSAVDALERYGSAAGA